MRRELTDFRAMAIRNWREAQGVDNVLSRLRGLFRLAEEGAQ